MKVDRAFAREAYAHTGAVRGYSRAVGQVGLWASEKAFFGRHLARQGRILDLGCGAGRTTFALHEEGYGDLVGADLSLPMIQEARRHAKRLKVRIPFRVADACRLPFRSSSFSGCVFSFNGLMTIPRRPARIAALREIRRVLSPGGAFVFTTHQRRGESLWKKERSLWRAGRQDPRLTEFGDQLIEELGRPTFIHVPDRREILDCLDAAGLEWLEDEFQNLKRESKAVRCFVSDGCRFWAARRTKPGRVTTRKQSRTAESMSWTGGRRPTGP